MLSLAACPSHITSFRENGISVAEHLRQAQAPPQKTYISPENPETGFLYPFGSAVCPVSPGLFAHNPNSGS